MTAKTLLFFLLVIACIVVSPTVAHSISFADVDTIQPMVVVIHESDGEYYGTWNTSSQGINLDPNESYFLTLKAEGVDRWTLDPLSTVQGAMDFIKNNALAFIILIILVGLIIAFGRR